MKAIILLTIVLAIFVLLPDHLAMGVCPQDPNDLGVCDTFYLECHNPVQFDPPPWDIYFPFSITHDVADTNIDSIEGIYIPFSISHTNPAAYCSVLARKNRRQYAPDTANSIFRHLGGMRNRLMDLYEQGNGEEWDDMSVSAIENYFRMSTGPWQPEDKAWWESSKVLFATMTLFVSDTMTIQIECAPWPPDDIVHVIFVRGEAVIYQPQQNMPFSVKVSYMPRGDANGDRVIDLSDVVYLISYLYRDGSAPNPLQMGDANCDGVVDLGDVVFLIKYVYKNGPVPAC